MLEFACRSLRTGTQVVELGEELVADLETWSPQAATAPRSLDLSVFVGGRSAAALDAGKFQVIIGPNLGANGTGRNLGRFASLFGSEGTAALQECAGEEESLSPRAVTAELVYRPQRFVPPMLL